MEIKMEDNGVWVGRSFVPFDQPMENIIKAVVEATEQQFNPSSAIDAFAEASRILRRNSSSIPAPKSIK